MIPNPHDIDWALIGHKGPDGKFRMTAIRLRGYGQAEMGNLVKVAYMIVLEVNESWNGHLAELDWRFQEKLEAMGVPVEIKRQYVLPTDEEVKAHQ
jgi:hypothetical protein